jgi:hypothetical protein
MMDFVENLGKQQGFEVRRERLTIDQFWKHETKGTVALEHEISSRGIFQKEIPNLMDVSSDLKVLITYVYDYQFPWEPERISRILMKEINAKYVGRFKEFVFVIGTKTRRDQEGRRNFVERESDWFARKFYIGAVKEEILVPISSEKARRAWQSRRRELCKHCGEMVPTGSRLKHLKEKHNIKESTITEHFDAVRPR